MYQLVLLAYACSFRSIHLHKYLDLRIHSQLGQSHYSVEVHHPMCWSILQVQFLLKGCMHIRMSVLLCKRIAVDLQLDPNTEMGLVQLRQINLQALELLRIQHHLDHYRRYLLG